MLTEPKLPVGNDVASRMIARLQSVVPVLERPIRDIQMRVALEFS